MHKPFWALLFLLSCTYSAALADDPTSESKGWGGVAPVPSENECRSFIEAALKEQRTQAEAGGGGEDATPETIAITQEEHQHAVNQVNEETTGETPTENAVGAEPSDVVEETNEKIEISEAASQEQGTSIEQEEPLAVSAEETLSESVIEEAPVESVERLQAEVISEIVETEGVLAESAEVEAVRAEEIITESTETEGVSAQLVETEGVPAESIETESVPVESAEVEGMPMESAEIEGSPIESAETETGTPEEMVAENLVTEPEATMAESAETGSLITEISSEVTGSAEADVVADQPIQEDVVESIGTEAVAESAEGTDAVAESAEGTETITESAEGTEAVAESAELTETITESAERVDSVEESVGTVIEEQHVGEQAVSTEEGVQQVTEEILNTDEVVIKESDSAAENVVTESFETGGDSTEPVSGEEPMLSDQPIEITASEETISDQNAGSQPEQLEISTEKEEVTEQPISQEIISEEIVEKVVQESLENVDASTLETESSTFESTKSDAEQTAEQTITETSQPSSEETQEALKVSTEIPETKETQTEPAASVTEEVTQAETTETPTPQAAVEEAPTKTAENVEPAVETQSDQVSESQAVVDDIAVEEETPEQEDLALKIEIPENLRPRNHIVEVLKLDIESVETENKLLKAEESTLKELKRVYEAAIKPLEILYKYRDLSNRHFGDPEIFSKPLILFMGPWSGGKSTIINYLLDNEYKPTALRSGAEPSPAYFNIVMWGEREEVMDGTQLAADWTFSGLQKFGQGLLDRLRGLKLNSPLLEKVNIVEIPGILEIRKQVERLFPLNDACQWFIDRADIIFLVYDPSKLDVGPETEAILDQLKGREYQTKIILNKADQVKPEELMRVQGTLIWNISPLMSSTEPPVMYSTSLWSHPYQPGSPSRLLFAQEKAFLKDFREAMEKRVENKISSARRFAVRVRNHAKMVDCYLTTYYNHKTFFGNKQKVSDDIIEHPQNYHIYEGLSTLTNISRYDLPDPDVYRDFFRLNPVYDFQQLSSTCTYFKGCPINRLDVAIAYDLPELVGKFKKSAEDLKKQGKK